MSSQPPSCSVPWSSIVATYAFVSSSAATRRPYHRRPWSSSPPPRSTSTNSPRSSTRATPTTSCRSGSIRPGSISRSRSATSTSRRRAWRSRTASPRRSRSWPSAATRAGSAGWERCPRSGAAASASRRSGLCWTRRAPADLDDAHAWISTNRSAREPWQRADETLAHMRERGIDLQALTVERDGETVGALVYQTGQGPPGVAQLAARDEQAAANLLVALAAYGDGFRIVNLPAGDPAEAALNLLRARRHISQREMLLTL